MSNTVTNPLLDLLSASWYEKLAAEFDSNYMQGLRSFLAEEIKHYRIYPSSQNTFNAFRSCPIEKIKVVILGQDPYHGVNQAHGLCFSVPKGIAQPPSLKNILKEINLDLGLAIPKHGDLSYWAQQGVFLLNTVLSVRDGQANSHAGLGWERFTDRVIELINQHCDGVVFMLWGSPARRKKEMIDIGKHLVLEAVHPSPLSAHRGFLGCKHFSQANNYLIEQSKVPIDWALT
jgi:uracil-DNA glycosylase